jgi:hypothetical protein
MGVVRLVRHLRNWKRMFGLEHLVLAHQRTQNAIWLINKPLTLRTGDNNTHVVQFRQDAWLFFGQILVLLSAQNPNEQAAQGATNRGRRI